MCGRQKLGGQRGVSPLEDHARCTTAPRRSMTFLQLHFADGTKVCVWTRVSQIPHSAKEPRASTRIEPALHNSRTAIAGVVVTRFNLLQTRISREKTHSIFFLNCVKICDGINTTTRAHAPLPLSPFRSQYFFFRSSIIKGSMTPG